MLLIKKILTSTDKGKTWNTLSVHPGGELIGMAILDHTFYLCLIDEFHLSGDNGVYRSDDNGASWVLLTPFDNKYPNIEPRAIAVIDNTVYVGTNKGLYRLNGNTWQQIFLDEIGEKAKYLPIISMEVTDNVLYVARSYHIDNNFRVFLEDRTPIHLTNDSWVETTGNTLEKYNVQLIGHKQQQGCLGNFSYQVIMALHGIKITPRINNTDKEELSIINLFNVNSEDKKDIKKMDTKSSHKSRGYSPTEKSLQTQIR